MDELGRLIVENEDWLTDRVVHYAHQNGHTDYTSTLREAWRLSIVQISKPIVAALADIAATRKPRGEALDEAAAYCLEQTRKHAARGIDIGMFLGLLVFYRRSFFDLVEEKPVSPEDRRRLLTGLMEIFDVIELGLVTNLVAKGTSDELEQLRAANRALVNEKNKYLTVFESLSEPAILVDQNDTPLHMNAAGHRLLLGRDAPGLGYYGQVDHDPLHELLGEIRDKSQREQENTAGITLDTVNGQRVFSVASRTMLDISDKFTGRVIILKDVTEYLAATEAAKDAEKAKSALLAMFSHEIKTPINSILALTHLIDDQRLDPEQQRHFLRLQESGRVLSELIENILGLSRVEARALRRLDQEFSLRDLIRSVMLTIESTATEKGLEVQSSIAEDVPSLLYGDMQKLRHILMNFLSNAVKFTREGGVTLHVTLSETLGADHAQLRFAVIDTGPGLPPRATSWLFEPFTQYEDASQEQSEGGTGLGLAICREFVAFLGGSISASPAQGGGSEFTFELPFATVTRQQDDAPDSAGLSILIVEDDLASARLIKAYLQELGHAPVLAENVRGALRLLETTDFDMVVSDQHLGKATGSELAQHLRKAKHARLRSLPFILMTADVTDVSNLPPDLVQYIVAKPYGPGELAQAIRQALLPDPNGKAAPKAAKTEPSEADTLETLLDRKRLDQMLADLGPERCKRIIDSYLITAKRLAAELPRFAIAQDVSRLESAAHRLASASSTVGLLSLARSAKQLQSGCKNGTGGALKDLVETLRRDMHHAIAELSRYRGNL